MGVNGDGGTRSAPGDWPASYSSTAMPLLVLLSAQVGACVAEVHDGLKHSPSPAPSALAL